ncbi:hypothetical protein C8R47DRAFT_1283538 [Mycena vitilis]|nr:hypothetical protein C8R47DRAFT_1283538 [Mycena vitilis]
MRRVFVRNLGCLRAFEPWLELGVMGRELASTLVERGGAGALLRLAMRMSAFDGRPVMNSWGNRSTARATGVWGTERWTKKWGFISAPKIRAKALTSHRTGRERVWDGADSSVEFDNILKKLREDGAIHPIERGLEVLIRVGCLASPPDISPSLVHRICGAKQLDLRRRTFGAGFKERSEMIGFTNTPRIYVASDEQNVDDQVETTTNRHPSLYQFGLLLSMQTLIDYATANSLVKKDIRDSPIYGACAIIKTIQRLEYLVSARLDEARSDGCFGPGQGF